MIFFKIRVVTYTSKSNSKYFLRDTPRVDQPVCAQTNFICFNYTFELPEYIFVHINFESENKITILFFIVMMNKPKKKSIILANIYICPPNAKKFLF